MNITISMLDLYNAIKTLENNNSSIPVGTIIDYYGTIQPDGWLICDGRSVPDTMPKLKSLIGNNTPDLRSLFRRTVGGNSNNIGVKQGDAIRNIVGRMTCPSETQYAGVSVSGPFALASRYASIGGHEFIVPGMTFDASRVVPTAEENRPINMAFNTLIYGGK